MSAYSHEIQRMLLAAQKHGLLKDGMSGLCPKCYRSVVMTLLEAVTQSPQGSIVCMHCGAYLQYRAHGCKLAQIGISVMDEEDICRLPSAELQRLGQRYRAVQQVGNYVEAFE